MNIKLRQAQKKILKIFGQNPGSFALAGGTALELYYLKHRFSWDLDFFSSTYNLREISMIISAIEKDYGTAPILENETDNPRYARMQIYTLQIEGLSDPLKIDFVEDTLPLEPNVKRFKNVPVYAIERIYVQKLAAITGVQLKPDVIGREILTGRSEARDVMDLYCLSQKIEPLHSFLRTKADNFRRGMVQWYRQFPRQDFKVQWLDLDIYDKKLDCREIIRHLEGEIKILMDEELK
ncbi:nucleotidyl transferase AbiEii/AbiGii toxin family protein [bacterium]|nr:nucleotidyl transferase AbiEii/AbiGii toxin family protein [bacterium]